MRSQTIAIPSYQADNKIVIPKWHIGNKSELSGENIKNVDLSSTVSWHKYSFYCTFTCCFSDSIEMGCSETLKCEIFTKNLKV
jgi:hypothetical protein